MDAAKKHHFLISAQIMFTDDQGNMGSAPVNGVLIQDQLEVPSASLGKAQQIVQFHFIKKMGEDAPKVRIVDVHIMNLVHLGEMTEAVFKAAPEGMSLKEATAQVAEATGRADLKLVPANG